MVYEIRAGKFGGWPGIRGGSLEVATTRPGSRVFAVLSPYFRPRHLIYRMRPGARLPAVGHALSVLKRVKRRCHPEPSILNMVFKLFSEYAASGPENGMQGQVQTA